MVKNIVHPIEWIEKADCSEALEANVEWQELSYIASKECLYLPPMYFKTMKPPMYDEQIFIAGLKELIIKQIKSYDKGVVVTDIAVVMK